MTQITKSVGVFTTDAGLIIQVWDATLARLTGISEDSASGQALTSLLPAMTAPVAAVVASAEGAVEVVVEAVAAAVASVTVVAVVEASVVDVVAAVLAEVVAVLLPTVVVSATSRVRRLPFKYTDEVRW